MTDQDRRDLQEFRALWSKLNETNREKAVEIAAEMLSEQIAREGTTSISGSIVKINSAATTAVSTTD